MSTKPIKRSLTLKGHRTSVSLEDKFWEEFCKIAERQNISINENQGVIDNSEVVFIGLTVDKAELVLKDLNFRKDQRVVSFMAAVSEKKIKELVCPAKFESVMIC